MKYAIISIMVLLTGCGCMNSLNRGPEQIKGTTTIPIIIMNPNVSSSTAIVALREFPTDAGYAFRYGDLPAIVVRQDSGYIAYLDDSPRPGCGLSLTLGVLKNPCTGSEFDPATGEVVLGPAKEPLTKIDIYVQGEALYVVNK